MRKFRSFSTGATVAAMLLCAVPSSAADDGSRSEELTYERHIRPIFKTHCFDCHGATEQLKGKLDLRLARFMAKGGESGPAIVPGSPEESFLVARLKKGEMPPGNVKVPAAEIAIIERWIAAGAKTARPEPETLGKGVGITREERQYWAFQPIRRPVLPNVNAAGRTRTAVDVLLLSGMAKRGLSFSPDADRRVLARRTFLDLLGLPPTRQELEAFLDDDAPDAYERLLDRLLASPHYGERWGRHWLDVAGYADSEGDTGGDQVRLFAYKYRDYVVRSLNAGKPFDQFIREQLAGDEMVERPYKDLSFTEMEKLIATGFLRMARDETASSGDDVAKNKMIADTLKIVSRSLLGLSVGCAQCHDHRYDPIPHTDYYRLRAVLEPALDWKSWRNPRSRRISLYTDEDHALAKSVADEANALDEEKRKKQTEYVKAALEVILKGLPEDVRGPLRKAYHTTAVDRTPEQNRLIEAHPNVLVSGGNLYQYNPKAAEEIKDYDKRINAIRSKKPFEDFLRVLTEEPGHVPETRLFYRGDHKQPKEVVPPGGLTISAPQGDRFEIDGNNPEVPTTGRRLAFGRWLTNGTHPLVGRVLVNRVWMHHFGRAIVSTPGDFGKLGTKPTHPVLLDWLADELVVQEWSLKRVHRLVMTSTAYRQTSASDRAKEEIDPENALYWRRSLMRLDAEIVRDRILAVSGKIDYSMFGRPVSVADHETGQIIVSGDSPRRSVYIEARRTKPVAMLKAFDAPVMDVNCDCRASSTVATQSLMLMNGDFVLKRALDFARRVRRAGGTVKEQIARVWTLAYGRPVTEDELQTAAALVSSQTAYFEKVERRRRAEEEEAEKEKAEKAGGEAEKNNKKDKKKPQRPEPELLALRSLCQALLSSNEFLYVD